MIPHDYVPEYRRRLIRRIRRRENLEAAIGAIGWLLIVAGMSVAIFILL
jgi:hypothetical protein